MKKITKTLIIAILGMAMVACSPTKSEKSNIVINYLTATEIYHYVVTYETAYGNETVEMYIAGKDRYDVDRIATPMIERLTTDYKLISTTRAMITLDNFQDYPYSYE